MIGDSIEILRLRNQVSLNTQLKAYVVRCGDQLTALSFSEVFLTANALAGRLNKPGLALSMADFGSLKALAQFEALLALYRQSGISELWLHPAIPSLLRRTLRESHAVSRKVILTLGDSKTGMVWLPQAKLVGCIGRANTVLGRPILLSDRQSTSGQPLMETAVLQVRDAASGAALYTHEHYHLPRLAVVPHNDQTAMVLHEGVQIAHSGSDVEANRFVAALLDGIGPSPVPRRPLAHHTIEREVANG